MIRSRYGQGETGKISVLHKEGNIHGMSAGDGAGDIIDDTAQRV